MRALVSIVLTFVIVLATHLAQRRVSLPWYKDVVTAFESSDAVLYDQDGNIIHELRVDPDARRLQWIKLGEISPALITAVLGAEDKRFRLHHGVDYRALLSAVWHYVGGAYRGGASTISMQLATLLLNSAGNAAANSWVRKLKQLQLASSIEQRWTKEEILESYLNLVTFRGELQGVEASARGMFGKHPHALAQREALILAVLIRAPNAKSTEVSARACRLAARLAQHMSCSDIQTAVEQVLGKPYVIEHSVVLAPHVARRLLGTGRGVAKTTLNRELQYFALERLQAQLMELKESNVNDGAVLVVENETGNVVAYLGNTGQGSTALYVDGVLARRQAGSTLKPFLYALALDKKYLTSSSIVDDSPVELAVFGGMYRPRNYDNIFHGLVRLNVALGSSLNVPAIRTLKLVGVGAFGEKLRQLGIDIMASPEHYGYSLALGSAEVSLWELVNAYRTLAQDGEWSPLKLELGKSTNRSGKRGVFSQSSSFIISEILADRDSRVLTFDLDSVLSTRHWSSVKTGTSRDMTDNWCIGFNTKYTVGVWVGNFSGEPMWNVSGVSGAAPVWHEIMVWLEDRYGVKERLVPPDVVERELPLFGGAERYYFMTGTEPSLELVQTGVKTAAVASITYPTDGLVMARDPDIPEPHQRVLFDADGITTGMSWRLDGINLGAATETFFWKPVRGSHELALVDATEEVLSVVRFRVN